MKKFILTIGREFGSRGGEIGQHIAEHYQIPFHNKQSLDAFARQSRLLKDSHFEHLEDLAKSGLPIRLWSGPDRELLKTIYETESDYIRVLTRSEGGVFVGRCADYILRSKPNHLSIFIYAPLGVRTNYLMNKYGLSLDATQTLIERMDQSRHNYYKYFTKENRGERQNRQFFLDSSLLGVTESARLIESVIDKKFC